MMLYSVPFTISGRIEIEAADDEMAYRLAENWSPRELVDNGLKLSADIDAPECEE